MYNESFGLRKNPFSLTSDPSFLFLTEQHREALCGLTFGILQPKGFVVLTGEVGTGKTTLLARVTEFLPKSRLQFSMILSPTLTPSEFLEMALMEFGVTDIPSTDGECLETLQNLIQEGRREGRVSALIVDEAHKLSTGVLEIIRMLADPGQTEDKCLHILLVGQTELDAILDRDDLGQLKQRIDVRLTLGPIAAAEVEQYIQHRWWRAGGLELPFSPEALHDLASLSQGIPRVINLLCDNALLGAFEGQSARVRENHVRQAAARLNLGEAPCQEEVFKSESPEPLTIHSRKAPRYHQRRQFPSYTQARKRVMS